MNIRQVAKTVGISSAVACAGALSALSLGGVAGAAPASGDQVGVATPQTPFTAGTPFSSGQIIKVTVPPNTVLPQGQNILIEECAAPGGVLPTLSSACDSNSVDGDTIFPATDGSISYTNYTLYALPDAPSLGESPTTTPVCNLANQCVLYIGTNAQDFTKPHFFSQAFKVNPTANDSGANPGDGTPEVPLAIGLPLAAAGIMGGILYRRRKVSRSDA